MQIGELQVTSESRFHEYKRASLAHHRGHRNQTNQPCELQKCSSYTYCGIWDKHPEYFAEMNKLKASTKKKHDDLKALQEQLTGIKNFVSQRSEQSIPQSFDSSYDESRPVV